MHDKPSVAMFMSADVVGSTAFKAAAGDAAHNWLEAFETLFRELPLVFIGEVAQAFMLVDAVPESGVWKVLGDEVIFVALPHSVEHAAALLAAFAATVASYDARIAHRWPLRIRGSCWAADLRGRNRMIAIPEMFGGQRGEPYMDFLGPDIDTGFRLSPHSGNGEVIVSPNLLEAIGASAFQPQLRFHPIGHKSLKGVIGGQPFPLILASNANDVGGAERGRPIADRQQLAAELRALREQLAREHAASMAPPVFA